MSTIQTVEEILRPLVEATVRRWLPGKMASLNDPLPASDEPLIEEMLDPRFEALRWQSDSGIWYKGVFHPGIGIDASLGAILASATACGYEVYRAVLEALLDEFGVVPATPLNEATARALVAAWATRKAASATEPGAR